MALSEATELASNYKGPNINSNYVKNQISSDNNSSLTTNRTD